MIFLDKIKIMHCGDLHIGATLSALGEKASIRRAELTHTLGSITAACREHSVELLLISGDLFDSNSVPRETVDSVRAFFAAIPETTVAVVPGNHDYLSADSPYHGEWSENVHIFRENESIKVGPVTLHGFPFTGPYCDEMPLPTAAEGANILLMHADLDGGRYNPVTEPRLAATGMDYVALGHIHKCSGVCSAGDVKYAYCGCPEPLGFDECGQKGVLLGTVGKHHCELSFLPLARREYREERLDVSAFHDNDSLLAAARTLLSDQKDNLIKLILEGSCDFSVDLQFIKTGLEGAAFFLKLRDRTAPAVDFNSLSQEQSLKGFFVRALTARKNGADGQAELLDEALRLGLAALDGRDVSFGED